MSVLVVAPASYLSATGLINQYTRTFPKCEMSPPLDEALVVTAIRSQNPCN